MLRQLIEDRFGLPAADPAQLPQACTTTLANILNRRSHRRFKSEPVPEALLQTLFAVAFSAPSKSDLQQACVVRVSDHDKRQRIADAGAGRVRWIAAAPEFMVWCGDARRLPRISEWRDKPFANDHLDAFMNAAVDVGIAMQTFIIAAEAAGLGCCPVSEVRDHIELLSTELNLPKRVFPVAGLCVGWPANEGQVSMRLPLSLSVHNNSYDDSDLIEQVQAYDRRREQREPTPRDKQRLVEQYGVSDDYGWAENRARQYSVPLRDDFGRYIRAQGFNLD